MTAICVGTIRLREDAAWERYRGQVGATIAQYGGTVLFRGAREQVLTGTAEHERVVAIRFDSVQAARRWHDSPEYQALVAIREQAAEVTLVLYQE